MKAKYFYPLVLGLVLLLSAVIIFQPFAPAAPDVAVPTSVPLVPTAIGGNLIYDGGFERPGSWFGYNTGYFLSNKAYAGVYAAQATDQYATQTGKASWGRSRHFRPASSSPLHCIFATDYQLNGNSVIIALTTYNEVGSITAVYPLLQADDATNGYVLKQATSPAIPADTYKADVAFTVTVKSKVSYVFSIDEVICKQP